MKNFLILVSLSTAGILGVIQLQIAWQAAQNREELAQSWSRDSVQFAAIGTSNRTLFAALPGVGQAEQDAFLASIVRDHHLENELQDLGFEHIQCGSRTVAFAR
jgi:hypothetical protein